MSLTEFLLARIAEDEEVARDFVPEEIENPSLDRQRYIHSRKEWVILYDPARVLAECEAKRRIVKFHESWPVLVQKQPEFAPADPSDLSSMTMRMSQQIAWATEQQYRETFGEEPPTGPMLRALAAVYADHPDYEPEWRP